MDSRDDTKNWENEMLEKYGWYIHYQTDGNRIDAHTHGLSENFNHPDLQIVLPISHEAVQGIFRELVDQIKEGKVFEEGKRYDAMIGGKYQVEFIKVPESGREVLRILFPDPKGKLPSEEDCDPMYRRQWMH
ncbi:DUF4262 domain-containing protein [Lihuaxuella thermophila]|uniref:DUF4262 domain-containing protein n=1 Tax=Lihuaxuella thermophila TaxID=1173111 RepID=A0A1H8H4N2_9BACL|nr:DUF4262 domain-containing protein [Lihuaxuella thermophila]SEN50448.1 protein of unknown function [Lihuaxuella thermophila]